MDQPDSGRPGTRGVGFETALVWNVASLAVLAVAGIALNALIGRHYGAAHLGVFNQVMGAYILFSMAASGGINFSLLRAIAEQPDDRGRVAGIAIGALLPALVLASLVAAAFHFVRGSVADALESPAVAIGMADASIGLFCFALNKQLLAIVNGHSRMRAFAVYQALRYLLILAGFVYLWRSGAAGDRLSLVWTYSEAILLLVLSIEVGLTVAWREAREVATWAAFHLRFGLRSILSAMLLELNAKVDIWMLGLWLDDARVGIYSFAANLAEGFYQLVVVLQNNVNPLLARHLAAGDHGAVEALVRRTRRWCVPAFLGVAAVSSVVYLWLPTFLTDDGNFRESWLPFSILVGAIAACAGWLAFGNLLLMGGRPGWHTLMMLASVAVNVGANALLIPRLGIDGAAAGTAVAFVASVITLRVLARRETGVRL